MEKPRTRTLNLPPPLINDFIVLCFCTKRKLFVNVLVLTKETNILRGSLNPLTLPFGPARQILAGALYGFFHGSKCLLLLQP